MVLALAFLADWVRAPGGAQRGGGKGGLKSQSGAVNLHVDLSTLCTTALLAPLHPPHVQLYLRSVDTAATLLLADWAALDEDLLGVLLDHLLPALLTKDMGAPDAKHVLFAKVAAPVARCAMHAATWHSLFRYRGLQLG